MFAKTIIDSDAFLEMPLSTQSLYFHLSMRADDDGFINNPKKIQRMIGASDDDLKILIGKRFLIPFESGIVVIKHWRIHNYIQSDRYKETVYLEEKEQLMLKENKSYSLKNDECIQNVYSLETQDRLGKDRIGKDSIGEESEETSSSFAPKESKHTYGTYKHVRLTDSDLENLSSEYGQQMTDACITFLDEYIEMKGYKAKNHYLCIKRWVVNAVKERQSKSKGNVLEESYKMMSQWAEEE